MVLQAYIDDSWDESGTYVLAGYVASVDQWAAFAKEWEDLLPLATPNKKGVRRFKMAEMARAGKMEAVPLFYKTIMKHVQMSISIIINKKNLVKQIDNLVGEVGDPAWGNVVIDLEPYKKMWRKPFFFAFRALMDTFHREFAANNLENIPLDGIVHFIFDQDDSEAYIRRIWDEYVLKRSPEYRKFYGDRPRFEKDEDFAALQAADFRAWWVRKWANEYGFSRVDEWCYPFEPGEKTIRHMILDSEGVDIQRIVAEAIGAGVQETVARGLPLKPSESDSIRYWPRPPL